MADLIRTAISGLRLSQLSLSITGQNIVNANTEGFSRQSVIAETGPASFTGSAYVGSGVAVADVRRNSEQFLFDQVSRDTSLYNEFTNYLGNVSQIDNLLADPQTGVAGAMDDFFEALHNAATSPVAIENRQLLLTRSESLLARLSATQSSLRQQSKALNTQFESMVESINTIAKEVAQLNLSISTAAGTSNRVLPNDLLDTRDGLLKDLAKMIDVKTVHQPNLSVDVFIGEGQALVVGPQPNELAAIAGEHDASRREIAIKANNNTQEITGQLRGGAIGGLARFRSEALDTALNGLGRITLALAATLNEQQSLGVTLDGELGTAMFTDINAADLAYSRVLPSNDNPLPKNRVIAVEIADLDALAVSDYKLEFPGPGKRFSLIRTVDGSLAMQGILPDRQPSSLEVDGLRLRFEAGDFQQGDSFLIKPINSAIDQIELKIDHPKAFAFAEPVAVKAGSNNAGRATLSVASVLDVTTDTFTQNPGSLQPPMMIRFNSPERFDVLDNSNPAQPVALVPPLSNQAFTPGVSQLVFSDDPGSGALESRPESSGGIRLNSTRNGISGETLNITQENTKSGLVTEYRIAVEDGESAASVASRLNSISGINAQAHSQLSLFDFRSDGKDKDLSLSLNGHNISEPLTVGDSRPDPLTADYLRDQIMANAALIDSGIRAESNGIELNIFDADGEDIRIDVGGNGGDSFRVRSGEANSIVGSKALDSLLEIPPNSHFAVEIGGSTERVELTPGSFLTNDLLASVQNDIDRTLSAGLLAVRMGAEGNMILHSVDGSSPIKITAVSEGDILGLDNTLITGPDIGEQPAILRNDTLVPSSLDFAPTALQFTLAVNSIYSETITLNGLYNNSAASNLVADINQQITASLSAGGISGKVRAGLSDDGSLFFQSTELGPTAHLELSGISGAQNILAASVATGQQLRGSNAVLSGALSASAGANFEQGGPHDFKISVDGYPAVDVELTGDSGVAARFVGSGNVNSGIDLTASPNSFDLMLAGSTPVTVDLSGVDTTLASHPFANAPQGIVALIQERIDTEFGAEMVDVDITSAGQVVLNTVATGASSSISILNATGAVASSIFSVPGTAVGGQSGATGVANIVANAINEALVAEGYPTVTVGLDESERLTINSTHFGDQSQIEISQLRGGFGLLFPGNSTGRDSASTFTVAGKLDLQLAEGVSLKSDRVGGLFGKEPAPRSDFRGFQLRLDSGLGIGGSPQAGDVFFVDATSAGSADNKNALAMVALADKPVMENGSLTVRSGYTRIVEQIGVLTNQARVSTEASESLLRQSESSLQSNSGVNIDEEAALLIRLEQHYNASARLISIARDLFNAILDL